MFYCQLPFADDTTLYAAALLASPVLYPRALVCVRHAKSNVCNGRGEARQTATARCARSFTTQLLAALSLPCRFQCPSFPCYALVFLLCRLLLYLCYCVSLQHYSTQKKTRRAPKRLRRKKKKRRRGKRRGCKRTQKQKDTAV